ncbi:MAG: NAD(P)-dependent oxidoreductase [Saprospiraceae bacterium]
MGKMFRKDVLVTDYVHPVLLDGLHRMGLSTTYAPEMTRHEMETFLPGYKGVVINTRCAIDKKTMTSAPSLQWIARLGSGLDIIDLSAAEECGITVISAPEGNSQAVAEHAMAMLLSLANHLLIADREVRQNEWYREKNRGWEISGKTIGIIGFGNNGSAFGRLWAGWDVTVLAYDKYKSGFGNEKIKEVSKEYLLQNADIISLHIPLTDETKEMINAEFISKCKKDVVIMNVARGKVINIEALINGLKSGHIKGACLDVYPFEPPSSGSDHFKKFFDELCTFDNVVLSPHVAGWTVESKRKISEVLLEKLSKIIGASTKMKP